MIQFVVPGKVLKNTFNYEDLIKFYFVQAVDKSYIATEKAVIIDVEAIYRKSNTNKLYEPMLKPTVDKISSVVMKSLKGLAYIDDKQVVGLIVRKIWGEPEQLIVKIEEVPAF